MQSFTMVFQSSVWADLLVWYEELFSWIPNDGRSSQHNTSRWYSR